MARVRAFHAQLVAVHGVCSTVGKMNVQLASAGDALGARGERWFAPGSFWNTPLPADARKDSQSDRWCGLLAASHDHDPARVGCGLHINLRTWTIPVFYADEGTAKVRLRPKMPECRYSQGHWLATRPYVHPGHPLGLHSSVAEGVPIPPGACHDGEADAHMVVVAPHENRIYDLWQCQPEDGGAWATNAAISYPLDGPGQFTAETITGIHDHESVHFYGPCRAAGVPAIAGLIRRDEVLAGEIRHKLAFACDVAALREFVSPAIWTDGWLPGGLPEGCVMQLDPQLDLDAFPLAPAARLVAKALQVYGAVLVDVAGGTTLYGEWLGAPDTSRWNGLLGESDLFCVPFQHYRILEVGEIHRAGSHPVYHHGMSSHYYDYLRRHGKPASD